MPEAKRKNDYCDALDVVKFYHHDWEYRHKHFWGILFKLFLTNIIVTLLPFISSINNVEPDIDGINNRVFPCVGFLITIFSIILLYSESKRLTFVSRTRNRIIKECLPKEFGMEEFQSGISTESKGRLSYRLVIFFGLFQVAVEVIVLFFLQ